MNTKKTTEMWAEVTAVVVIAMLLAVAAFAGGSFRFFGPISRIITPNGDPNKNNGTAIFCFDNPEGSGVTGSIFTLLGTAVASTGPEMANPTGSGCPVGTLGPLGTNGSYVSWDGRSNGTVVHSGIYVYRITADQKNYTGTILVVR